MKSLIFGANGQDGFYLHLLCKQQEIECIAISRSSSPCKGNISNYEEVKQFVQTYKPIYIPFSSQLYDTS